MVGPQAAAPLDWGQASGRIPAPGSNSCRYERPSRRQALDGPMPSPHSLIGSGVFNILRTFWLKPSQTVSPLARCALLLS